MSTRSGLKTAVETALSALGVARAAERSRRNGTAILSYHNIVPDGETAMGDRSLHLPESGFRDQLDCLQTHYEIVGLEKLSEQNTGTAPRVAITFDDAYAGAVVAGLAELERRGLPATVFVSSGMLEGRSFWWDRLAGSDGVLPNDRRDYVLWELAGSDEAARTWMSAEGIPERELPEHAHSATVAQLSAAQSALVSIGGHGWGHLNFAALDPRDLRREIEAPAETLKRDFGGYRPWVAYPYGLSSPAVEVAAAHVYDHGFLIEGGLATPSEVFGSPHRVARINVPAGLSPNGLRLRVAGLL